MTNHKWSGRPGAICLKCGVGDPLENAIGLGWYDPATNTWDTEEHKKECEQANVCSIIKFIDESEGKSEGGNFSDWNGAGWYFFDETWAFIHGPFSTEEEAEKRLIEYCKNI